MNIKRCLLPLLVIGLVTAACGSSPTPPAQQTKVHLQAKFQVPELVEGQEPSHNEMNYLLWLPEGYGQDPDKQWPLILFLHGAGGLDNDSAFVMSAGLPQVLYSGDQPADFGFVVVSPQAFPIIPWWEGDTLAILNLLLEDVIAAYQIDPARVYLTGLSMGGYGSWWLATAYPEKFAALVSVSGSGYRTPTPPPSETVCRLQDIPVWAIHGAKDIISDLTANKVQVIALLECAGEGEVKLTVYVDAGHRETFERAYRDPAIYEWMLQHSK